MGNILPMIDWTINVGNLITIFTIVGGGIFALSNMQSSIISLREDVLHIEKRQDSLNEAFNQLGKILTQVAVQDSRLNMVEKNIDELRHGRGYIRPPKND